MIENSWLDIAKVVLGIATPVVVAVLGVLLLRRIEGVKAEVAKRSDFHTKWAEQFFDSCQDFLRALERELAVLTALSTLQNPNDDYGTELKKEVLRLHPMISELELRIRRCVVFAPKAGRDVAIAADACIKLVGAMVALKQGNVDKIIESMNEFNASARRAHAEMLGIGAAEPYARTLKL